MTGELLNRLGGKHLERNDSKLESSGNVLIIVIEIIFRYVWYYWHLYREGRRPCMDYIHCENGKRIYGVPIGIGSGTIGRGFRGEFCRFQLRPGKYEYNTVIANQFIINIKDANKKTIFQSVLSTYEKPSKPLECWQWELNPDKCSYTGLYPRSWTEYDLSEYGIKLTCRQVSPVIPHEYKDSCLPCAVFVWSVDNICSEERTVSITFSFKNGTGTAKQDAEGNASSFKVSNENITSVCISQAIDNMICTYNLSTRNNVKNIQVSTCDKFDPCGNGGKFWQELYENGCFTQRIDDGAFKGKDVGVAICAQSKIAPNNSCDFEFALSWDMPSIHFMGKNLYKRYYTKYFEGKNAGILICEHALTNYKMWEEQIYNWQSPILNDSELPDWYKGSLFNELYYVSDGGTVRILPKDNEFDESDPRYIYGRFAYLEGHEYRMYNTYDVHFYASQALAMLWPKLEMVLQTEFIASIDLEIKDEVKYLYDGLKGERKIKCSVPHDLGDPWEEPFVLVNTYPIHDVSEWRDLNVKLVLQLYRDYRMKNFNKGTSQEETYDDKWLIEIYHESKKLIEKCLKWDTDDDGLIENSDSPDQTYDTWVMKGPSAYCAGLWLAALHCVVDMAHNLNYKDDFDRYKSILDKGKKSFDEKLWNGKYYRFDTSGRNNTIMSDQLCGHWYMKLCGFDYEVFPKDRVKNALKTIFHNNVMSFRDGSIGAVNGFIPADAIDDQDGNDSVNKNIDSDAISRKGCADPTTIQSEEIWTGVTYALASTMIFEGMIEEAFKTAEGLSKSLFEMGMNFETPEALYAEKHYRAIGYMRPLSIWSMQFAWEQRKDKRK
ncbi:LOW QUALITY PROTEIN: non-lysosomal glucosylceramidase-like [Ctenocephalides felis]|uniref:LOW QUALITY PROTEIN: non-lysosomal glucosylceramidase-like n=1 Tax=Ctenocephalides felis TaxID=7515 RepID=UPI000E6E1DF5|nr:LOW QUALITY PROTEIN: non-lysosomal glucosylceramidase-like [Ctenocephalides felis]